MSNDTLQQLIEYVDSEIQYATEECLYDELEDLKQLKNEIVTNTLSASNKIYTNIVVAALFPEK